MSVSTGTPETRTSHSKGLGGLGVAVAVGTPAVLALIGLSMYGFEAISWLGAIVWGFVATLVMTAVMRMGRSMEMTRMDLLDLLGSMFAEPGSSTARSVGAAAHFMNGILLAIGWAYTMVLIGWAATWISGMVWGAFISIFALLMLSSIGVIHPAVRDHRQDDPGTAGMNFGAMTPVGLVVAHLVYGFVLGLLYQYFPLT